MGANTAERKAPEASNVFSMIQGAEGFAMRRNRLRDTKSAIHQEIAERWATYREGDTAASRQVADSSAEAHAARFVFMAKHVASVESNIHNTTIWLRVPSGPGNPFGIGAEFSGRTLAHAVDAAIAYINLTK